MSGHSKWATIKRKKGATDAARGKVFTKHANAITVAVRQGGADPASNMTLRYAIDKARQDNMPRENIERAIKRGTGELAGATLEAFSHDAMGPEGAALIIEGVTDKKTRTLSELRNLLQQFGAKLVDSGSSRFLFTRLGMFTVPTKTSGAEAVELAAIESGAEDVEVSDEGVQIFTAPTSTAQVRSAMIKAGFEAGPASIGFIAKNNLTLNPEALTRMTELLEALVERDDVQQVATNF